MKSIPVKLGIFPGFALIALAGSMILGCHSASAANPIRVLMWDEQQPEQQRAYSNFLGNEIAAYLGKQSGLTVRSVRLDDPEQGLETLDRCDILIWWGHRRQGEIKPETGKKIVNRIKAGQLSLITLHSAHWSTPFVEAMNERARMNALQALSPEEQSTAILLETNQYPQLYIPPKFADRLPPCPFFRKPLDGPVQILLIRPNCCFPAFRADGKPSQVRVLVPNHPIARGLPRTFAIPQTEMYDEPFHVPPPDVVVLEERWAAGEWFRSGSVWNLGKGKVFYFRPGHETFSVYLQKEPLQVVENAVRRLGS